jgi:hypothetical protein
VGMVRRRLSREREEGEAECEGLAGTGLCFAAHVTAGDGIGDREGLDGEWRRDARSIKGVDEARVDAERGERGHLLVLSVVIEVGLPGTP